MIPSAVTVTGAYWGYELEYVHKGGVWRSDRRLDVVIMIYAYSR